MTKNEYKTMMAAESRKVLMDILNIMKDGRPYTAKMLSNMTGNFLSEDSIAGYFRTGGRYHGTIYFKNDGFSVGDRDYRIVSEKATERKTYVNPENPADTIDVCRTYTQYRLVRR